MLTKFAKPYEKSHEKNLNCFERYDALFEIKNNFQFLVLGTPEGYPALDPFNFIKVDSKFGIMTQSSGHPICRLVLPGSLKESLGSTSAGKLLGLLLEGFSSQTSSHPTSP